MNAGRRERSLPTATAATHLRSVAFTPDGRLVSATSIGTAGGDVFVHDLAAAALPAITKQVPDEPYSFAVSPRAAADGSVAIAVGSYYGTTQVLALTGTPVQR